MQDLGRDLAGMRLERKMSGVEQAHPRAGYVARVRLGARRQEERIVLAPHRQQRRLVLAEIGLEVRIEGDVGFVVAEKIELRFVRAGSLRIEDRRHFLQYAGRVMRSVIVDFVRERTAQRRGGDVAHVALDTGIAESAARGEDEILRVHEALEELAAHDERMVRVVEMRYFGGLSEAEIAESLGVTTRTERRDWEKARLLLAESLK